MTPELRRLFFKAVQDRKTLFNIFGKVGDSSELENDGEDEDRAATPQVTPAPESLKLRAGLAPFYTDINTFPDPKLNNDGEPDVDYPFPNDLYKALKVNRIDRL